MDFTVFLCRNQHFFGMFAVKNNKTPKYLQNIPGNPREQLAGKLPLDEFLRGLPMSCKRVYAESKNKTREISSPFRTVKYYFQP